MMSDAHAAGPALDVFVLPQEASEAALHDRTVAVIDVLRACTSIPVAFREGAEKVIPADSVESATRLMSTLDREHALLCGERGGEKVSGFDLGNSPREYVRAVVEGKTLVFASTNGSKVLARSVTVGEMLVCSFVNVSAVSDRLAASGDHIAVILAGQGGRFSLEDAVCAGRVVSHLRRRRPDLALTDGAHIVEATATSAGDVLAMLRSTSHGRYLDALGFGEDLVACAAEDSVPIVPVCREGRITLDVT
jgi:2-phosphosulfolactate phosphatase